MMNLGRGLRFAFADSQWATKVLIGTLLSLVPVLNLVATAYMFDVVRNVAAGRETPLPEWDNVGDKLLRGFLGAVVSFLWTLPLLVLVCPLYLFIFISAENTSSTAEPSAALSVAFGCMGLLVFAASLVLTPLTFVAISRYAVTNDFGAALPGPVFRQIVGNKRPWVIMMVALVGVSLVAVLLAICTFGIGVFLFIPFMFFLQLVQAHWMGQAYRASSANQPLPFSMV